MTALVQAIRGATAPWRAMLELTKPRLSSLVLFTTLVGYGAGLNGSADAATLIHVLLGTAFVAGGANAFNQVLERNSDALMHRTRTRPLPTGRLQPTEALRFAVLISVVGLGQLLLGVNLLTAFLGAVALSLYVFVYTPLKHITVHNTLVGAVVGAIPPLMGWSAATGGLDSGAWMLAGILFLWQLPHFFAIAWIYRNDYRRGGYRMLSVPDATGRITRIQVAMLSLLLIPVSLVPAIAGLAGSMYTAAAVALGIGYWIFCIWPNASRQMTYAKRSFVASIVYLPVLLAFFLIDKL